MPVVTEQQITSAHRKWVGRFMQAVCNASSTEAKGSGVTNPFLERQVSGRHFGALDFRSWADTCPSARLPIHLLQQSKNLAAW
jgi:hypothetical protein